LPRARLAQSRTGVSVKNDGGAKKTAKGGLKEEEVVLESAKLKPKKGMHCVSDTGVDFRWKASDENSLSRKHHGFVS